MFALISSGSGSQSAMLLRWALQGHHGPLVRPYYRVNNLCHQPGAIYIAATVTFVQWALVALLGIWQVIQRLRVRPHRVGNILKWGGGGGGGGGEYTWSVAFVTGVPNWYWLIVGQGLLSLQQVWIEREYYYFFCSFTFFHFPFSFLSFAFFFPTPFFHLLYYLFCLFSPFLWDTTQGLTCS